MATTTNYGWTTPDDTALVKDGAAAIRTLGSSVDTTTKNLNPETTLGDISYRSSTANVNTRLPLGTAGQVLKVNSGATAPEWATDASGMTNPMTTTGDTIYSSSGSTPARLGIGSTGQVLTVAAGVPSWATPAVGGGMTSLASGSLSGSSLALTSISGSYKHLQLRLSDFDISGGPCVINLTFMGVTSNYTWQQTGYAGAAADNTGVVGGSAVVFQNNLNSILDGDYNNNILINIYNYADSTSKFGDWQYYWYGNQGGADSINQGSFINTNASSRAALTSLTITATSARTFGAGTYILYGVN